MKPKVGIVAGVFDIIHPGYIRMLREAKRQCDRLVVALQVANPGKPKPIFPVDERENILLAIRYVDAVTIYETEEDLEIILRIVNPDVRFLGEDYADGSKPITGKDRCPIIYLERKHGFSATAVRNMIKEAK